MGFRYATGPAATGWGGQGHGSWGTARTASGRQAESQLAHCPPQLPNQSELRAPTAEKAALYLDAALAARGSRRPGCSSHLVFTLHVYQYRVEKCGRGGSRCRLSRPCLPSLRCLGSGEPGGPGVRGQGHPGPLPHLPALCFQCLEAAAACTSSTWAGVRGRLAGAGKPPGDPRVCLCQPWAVSSWPWSAEPSMCPIGERWAPWRVGAR